LEANIEKDLLISEREKIGFAFDVTDIFQIVIPTSQLLSNKWENGRDISSWVASRLEQTGRLVEENNASN
jgi:hypothetical protein